ncbi:MAG: deoxyhypusine synthase [Nanoarchaeota archaeon]
MKLMRMEKDIKKKHAQYSPSRITDLAGHPEIRGVDFEKKPDLHQVLDSYLTQGFQATNLGKAIEIVRKMRKSKAKIFLAFTSNQISSGNREIITFLVKHKFVDAIVTAAGGIEEDVIKTLKPFVLGDFHVPGRMLFERGVNRTGNIFIPNDRFTLFEQFIDPFLEEIYARQKKENHIFSTTEVIRLLGLRMTQKDSYLYWAARNDIPVFCPGITDGSFGDMVFFLKQRHRDFALDISKDMYDIVTLCLNTEKAGAIILGSGIAKHFTLNANIFREGLDYAVYITTAEEFDGSDSGARPDEAVTWGKIKANALSVKVHGDATIIFPLLVAATFAKEFSVSK